MSRDLSTRSFGPATAKYRELGTAANLLTFNRFGTLPTRNFQSGTFEGAERLSPETLSVAHARTRGSCVACTIGCEHMYALELKPSNDLEAASQSDARWRDAPTLAPGVDRERNGLATPKLAREDRERRRGVRLEYESLFALGSLCGVSDGDAVLRASQRCDELGIDTISAGGTIAFAMECVERGMFDQPWLRFGSGHLCKLLFAPARPESVEIGFDFTSIGNEHDLSSQLPAILCQVFIGLCVEENNVARDRAFC